jgi:sirohydrochlorin cobaltochelatase
MEKTALILFAHGSSDPEWALPLQHIAAQLRQACASQPHLVVELAFLERMTPTLLDCMPALVAQGVRRVQIVPMFMAQGSHLKQDLPTRVAVLEAHYPEVRFELSTAIGEAAPVVNAIVQFALQQGSESLKNQPG